MKNLILSFNFSNFSGVDCPNFFSFKEKLQMYMNIFEKGYLFAKQQFPQHKIILVTHEYAITQANSSNSKILDYTEHMMIQESLKEFTRLNQNCVIIFPYAFAKEYHNEQQFSKLEKIAHRYKDNVNNESTVTVEKNDFSNYLDKFQSNKPESKMTVIRNCCYLFSEGKTVSRVDKRIPCFEYNLPNSSIVRAPLIQGCTLFQPGTHKNIISLNKTQSLGIEICADHACGLLKSTWKDKSLITYHLILADSTALKTENLIGQFNILCDTFTGTSLVQKEGIDKKIAPLVIAITPEFNEGLLECPHKIVNPQVLHASKFQFTL
ncbi:MAG: hypothetical protein HYX60_08455 [Legionella longbeachae]|nr:hypothetical protein [Legionella longbeachae]